MGWTVATPPRGVLGPGLTDREMLQPEIVVLRGRRARAGSYAEPRNAREAAEVAGGIVEPRTDVIHAGGFCGARFGHIRTWAMRDCRRSAPHWRQR